MEAFSFIALILLSLVGYSAGATRKAGRVVQLKPQIIDLILVAVIWAGAIYARIIVDLDRWLLILAWVILSSVVGMLAVWPRKLYARETASYEASKQTSRNPLKKLWRSWMDFSKRMGEFQSRIVLSLFFFVLVSPFALGVKIFSDPLRLKYRSNESHWLPKMKTEVNLEQSRKQF